MIDATELSAIWDANADRLLLIARAIGGPADDAVQEAFIALATQKRLPDDPLAWLVRVTRNQLLQWHRRDQRRQKRELASHRPVWFASDPADVETKINADEVTEMLKSLPSRQREVIVMHLWGDMTFDSIAEAVGGSRAKAHRLFQQGIEQLKTRLEGNLNPESVKVNP